MTRSIQNVQGRRYVLLYVFRVPPLDKLIFWRTPMAYLRLRRVYINTGTCTVHVPIAAPANQRVVLRGISFSLAIETNMGWVQLIFSIRFNTEV